MFNCQPPLDADLGYCTIVAADEKFIFVRAFRKSDALVGKFGCRLENHHATARLMSVCINSRNRFCLTNCDLINYNDVTSTRNSYVFIKKCTFLSATAGTAIACLSHRNSVCPSVCLSHGWIRQKRCKLGSSNLHHRLPKRL